MTAKLAEFVSFSLMQQIRDIHAAKHLFKRNTVFASALWAKFVEFV